MDSCASGNAFFSDKEVYRYERVEPPDQRAQAGQQETDCSKIPDHLIHSQLPGLGYRPEQQEQWRTDLSQQKEDERKEKC
jgi:hypothetical protein